MIISITSDNAGATGWTILPFTRQSIKSKLCKHWGGLQPNWTRFILVFESKRYFSNETNSSCWYTACLIALISKTIMTEVTYKRLTDKRSNLASHTDRSHERETKLFTDSVNDYNHVPPALTDRNNNKSGDMYAHTCKHTNLHTRIEKTHDHLHLIIAYMHFYIYC